MRLPKHEHRFRNKILLTKNMQITVEKNMEVLKPESQ